MSFSNLYESYILNWLFNDSGFTVPDLYLGLAQNIDDTDQPPIGEPTGLGYFRLAVPADFWSIATNGVVSNILPIIWTPGALEDWGTVTYFVILSDLTEGELIIFGELEQERDIAKGSLPRFDVGELKFTLD